ncbi:MAG: hypothetical protein M0C28_09480 [Candidatus Moduliflexus flocculans]|nr:hypothetical protein [Candidatus Moduliflexus flocculans]
MKKYFDSRERSTLKERKETQDQALSAMVKQGYKKSARLKKTLDTLKINPAKIKTREDLEILPVTSREKLVEMEMQASALCGAGKSLNTYRPDFYLAGACLRAAFIRNGLSVGARVFRGGHRSR